MNPVSDDEMEETPELIVNKDNRDCFVTEPVTRQHEETVLKLDNNKLTRAGLEALLPYVAKGSKVEDLSLASNDFGDAGVDHLCKIIKDPTCILRFLCLRDNRLTDESLVEIGKCLRTNTTLEHLDMSHNHITDYGAQSICVSMTTNSTLKNLYLAENEIGSEGALHIAKLLTVNRGLERVSLSSCHHEKHFDKQIERCIGNYAGSKFAEVLCVNPVLKAIELDGNYIDQMILDSINEVLADTRLRKLLIKVHDYSNKLQFAYVGRKEILPAPAEVSEEKFVPVPNQRKDPNPTPKGEYTVCVFADLSNPEKPWPFPTDSAYFDDFPVKTFIWSRIVPREVLHLEMPLRHEQDKVLMDAIVEHADQLYAPNVSICLPSNIRFVNGEIVEEFCIIAVVHHKGLISFGSWKLPEKLRDGTPVDVIDQEFRYVPKAHDSSSEISKDSHQVPAAQAEVRRKIVLGNGPYRYIKPSSGKAVSKMIRYVTPGSPVFGQWSNSGGPKIIGGSIAGIFRSRIDHRIYGLTCSHVLLTDDDVLQANEDKLKHAPEIIGTVTGDPLCVRTPAMIQGVKFGKHLTVMGSGHSRDPLHQFAHVDARLFRLNAPYLCDFHPKLTLQHWRSVGYTGKRKPHISGAQCPVKLQVNMVVYKVGQKTGITRGKLRMVRPFASARRPMIECAALGNMLIISDEPRVPFSYAEDSGSMVYYIDEATGKAYAIAVLFAGDANAETWKNEPDGRLYSSIATPLNVIQDHFHVDHYVNKKHRGMCTLQ